MRLSLPLLVLASGIAALACSDSTDPAVCTADFRILTLSLYDTLGAPVVGAAIRDSLSRTAQVITPGPLSSLPAGTYDAFDDGSKQLLRATGDTVIVLGSKGQSQFAVLKGGGRAGRLSCSQGFRI